jgi:hypothetical protein
MKKRLLYTAFYMSLLFCLGYGCFRNVSADTKSRENRIKQKSVRVTSADYLFAVQEHDPLRAN